MTPRPIPRPRTGHIVVPANKSARLLRSRHMTIAAGFVCVNGIVLCADSQESAGDYKFPVEKLVTAGGNGFRVAMAGAGHGPFIDMAIGRINRSFRQKCPDSYDAAEDCITETLSSLYDKEFKLCPLGDPEDGIIELLAGVKIKGLGRAVLYKTYATAVSRVEEHAVIGSGRAVQYQIHKLYRPYLPTSRVIPIAVNLLNVASVVLRSVGGEGRIAVVYDLDGGAIGTVGGNEIDVVKSALENLETAAGSLLLDLLDVTKSDEDFRKALFEFSSLAIELRVSRVEEHKNFMAMLEAMSEALSGKTEEKITLSDAQTSEDQQ